MPLRIPVVAMVVALGLTVGVVALPVLDHRAGAGEPAPPVPARTAAAATATGSGSVGLAAVAVLRDWDRQRAAAWADGDARALLGLYTPGSPAGAADVALLRSYAARGLVVHGLRMQLLAVRRLVDRPRRLELEVTDRLAGATAVRSTGSTRSWVLPVGTATTRVLVLRRVDGRWRMARVSSAQR